MTLAVNSIIFLDPSVSLFTENSGSFFIKGETQTYNLDIMFGNDAGFGSGNNIPAAQGSNQNFAFTVQLSAVDLSTGGIDTLSVSSPLVTSDNLQQSLDAGTSVTIAGTADLTTPASSLDCVNTRYLCVTISEGSGALYRDVDNSASSNIVCNDISSMKTCDPGKYMIFYSSRSFSISEHI